MLLNIFFDNCGIPVSLHTQVRSNYVTLSTKPRTNGKKSTTVFVSIGI